MAAATAHAVLRAVRSFIHSMRAARVRTALRITPPHEPPGDEECRRGPRRGHAEPRPRRDGRDTAASGFLLKDATAASLFDAVRVVAAGDALLAPSVTRRLINEFARQRSSPPMRPDQLRRLTPRETEVLRHVADGLTNAEIAGRLVVAEETVKTHVSRILAKLVVRDRTQAIIVAYESGLVVPRGAPPPPSTGPPVS
jgi:DNA-binding CsgD family transcriptional regulator